MSVKNRLDSCSLNPSGPLTNHSKNTRLWDNQALNWRCTELPVMLFLTHPFDCSQTP